MPFLKGNRHTPETCARMSEARRGKQHSPEHRAKISAANKGRVFEKKYERTCRCGNTFRSAAHNSKFCSTACKRADAGHGLRHAPQFMHFAQQCAICAGTTELVGDHEHSTGFARGVLCRKCNLAIGNMRDDPALLHRAAEYLERFERQKRSAVYLSGPMSGLPESNYPAFHRAARALRQQGLRVENPAENAPPACGTWEGWMRAAIRQLMRCETIVLLPGHERSKGATLELHIARQLGMRVEHYETLAGLLVA